MYDFSYLIDRIRDAEFTDAPFRHLHIDDFFKPEHFEALVSSPEVALPPAADDEALLDSLEARGFEAIPFPGCITDRQRYVAWHRGDAPARHHSATEGFGMALRLTRPSSPVLAQVIAFLESRPFCEAIAEKLSVDLAACTFDGGVQKYLDGYEISPHPDIRKKAATFMVNINPGTDAERRDHHTHYLRMRPERAYVQAFWEGNPEVERAWVPWSWTETVYQQTRNNSIVLFSPSDDTLHGVRARYDHLPAQRTQLYGNLWYREEQVESNLEWEQLDLRRATEARRQGLRSRLARALPPAIAAKLRDLAHGRGTRRDPKVSGI